MAERRMFTRDITESDAFLDMPQTTQNLYFHLGMNADDEGFVSSPKKVLRMVGANQNDLDILIAKKYLILFKSGIVVVKHWKLNNTLRKDRLKETVYTEEKSLLLEKPNGAYTLNPTSCSKAQPIDNQVGTNCTHSIVECSVVEDSIVECSVVEEQPPKKQKFIPDISLCDEDRKPLLKKWLEYKTKIKSSYKSQVGIDTLIKKFSKYSVDEITFVMDATMENEYKGLIWDKLEKKSFGNTPQPPRQGYNSQLNKEDYR